MGRGARPTVRWKHDRIRAKKRRVKRQAHLRHDDRIATATTTATA